jgi:tetratricopeptide (TPR) repeat protein
MHWLLLLALNLADPISEAGTAYRQALQALDQKNYEEAVQMLRGALQKLGEENDELKYRDGIARQRHSYYPYYEWAVARQMQAQQEPSIFARRDLLKEALSRLAQTRHPDAPQRIEETKQQLAVVEKAISLDSSFASVKTAIEVLGTGERFEEALKKLDEAASSYLTREKELAELRVSLKERQTALERRYEGVLAQRLGDVALSDPVAAGDAIPTILKPAQIPAAAVGKPGAPFGWLKRFLDLWEKHQDAARRSADLPGSEVNAISDAFEASALDAIASGVPPGFRAARHVAHAVRMAKLGKIATGSEDVLDTKTASLVAVFAGATATKAADGVKAIPASDPMAKTLEADVPTRQKQIDDLYAEIQKSAKERARLTGPIVRSEQSMSDGDTLGDSVALGKVRNDLIELESEATFGTLTPRLRARALMAHALAEATLAFMEGTPTARVVDRCRLYAWRAYGFDPKVDALWAGKLSPKLLKVLDQIRPQ